MRSVAGDDLIHRTIDTAFQCGYRLIGEMTSLLRGVKSANKLDGGGRSM